MVPFLHPNQTAAPSYHTPPAPANRKTYILYTFSRPRLKKIIFVHGCFWHLHACKYGRPAPKTNAAFWLAKRQANKTRDRRNQRALKSLGWQVLILWQCQTRNPKQLTARLKTFLANP